MVLTISDDHYKMLEQEKKNRGLNNTQEAIRSVLEDVYSANQTMNNDSAHKISKRTAKQAVGAVA